MGDLIPLTTPQTAEKSAIETSPWSAISLSQSALPTVTYLSYITLSNDTNPTNSSSLVDDPRRAAMTQSPDMWYVISTQTLYTESQAEIFNNCSLEVNAWLYVKG